MNPKETIKHIAELAVEAENNPTWLTFPAITTHSDKIIVLEDGYNGQKCAFFYEPIERDGDLVRLRCAEPGKEYMTAWRHESVLRTEPDHQEQLS